MYNARILKQIFNLRIMLHSKKQFIFLKLFTKYFSQPLILKTKDNIFFLSFVLNT